jgi:hypothetical protein
MKRTTGTCVLSTMLGESVQAFVPHPLPPADPELAPQAYTDLNHKAERVRKHQDTSFPTAAAAVKALENLGIVTEMTGQKKNRSSGYQRYIELLSADQR